MLTQEQIDALPYRPNVGVMLVNADGHVFVGQRLDHAGAAWQMPQGGIDKGEDPEAAALRELQEETGVAPELVEIEKVTPNWVTYELPPELVGKVFKGKYRGQKQLWYRMRFLGSDDQINIATDEPEFLEWRWLPIDDLVDNIVPFKREVYEKVVEALA